MWLPLRSLGIILSMLAPLAGMAQGQKGAGVGSRLVGYTEYGFQWNGSYSTVLKDSIAFFYANATVQNYSAREHYSSNGTTWSLYDKTLCTFDASGFLTDSTNWTWNLISLVFVNSYRFTYLNNIAGYPTDEIYQEWDPTAMVWENKTHTAYTLDAANHVIGSTSQAWDNTAGAWANLRQDSLALNAQGYTTQKLSKIWQYAGSTWKNDALHNYTYDASGTRQTQEMHYWWIGTSPSWIPLWRYQYSYNTNGLLIEIKRDRWNSGAMNFDTTSKIRFQRDAAGNDTLQWHSIWIYGAGPGYYNDTLKMIWTYNSDNQPTTSLTLYNGLSDTFIIMRNSILSNYYYEKKTTTVTANAATSAALTLFPIPADNNLQLTIKWEVPQSFTATITDMQGRIYQTFSAPAAKEFSTALSLTGLPSGNYNLQLAGTAGSSASRMITVCH